MANFMDPNLPMLPRSGQSSAMTLAELLRSGKTPEEINALLSGSTVSSGTLDPNFMAGEPYMPPQQTQPMNSLINMRTGREVPLLDAMGRPSQSQMQRPIGDMSQNPVDTPFGRGYYMKGDNTRVVLADGRIADLGRDTGRERAMMKEDLGLDAQRANIAHTQMQTDPAKAAEYARQVAEGKQKGEMTGFGNTAQQNSTGTNALSGLPPAMADQVKALAEGRMAFPSGFALKSPYWQKMLQMVSQYDPNFDAINYNARSKTRQDFTSGKSAENIKSLNTAIGHLDTITQKFDALENSSFPSYNTSANWIGSKLGNEKIQSAVGGFDTAKLAVSGEMAKVFRSVGMSQQEIEHWMDRLSSSQSPADFKSTIKTATDLMGGRLDAIGDQYTKGMGKSTQGLDLLSPDAKKQFQKIQGGGNTSGGTSKSVTLPNGTVKVFPSGAAAEAFRMETGLK